MAAPCGARSISTRCAPTCARCATWSPPAPVLAVVKANGYGHGAAPVARAAARSRGAVARASHASKKACSSAVTGSTRRSWCCRSRRCRRPKPSSPTRSRRSSTPRPGSTRWPRRCVVRRHATACRCTSRSTPACTASGCDPDDALAAGRAHRRQPELDLAGVCTHLAVADEPDNPYTAEQLARFDAALARAARRRSRPGHRARGQHRRRARAVPTARHDLVRIGIARLRPPAGRALGRPTGRVRARRSR